jgi:hypothetical protein
LASCDNLVTIYLFIMIRAWPLPFAFCEGTQALCRCRSPSLCVFSGCYTMSAQVWLGNIPQDMSEAAVIAHVVSLGLPRALKILLRSSPKADQFGVAHFASPAVADAVLGATIVWPNGRYALVRPDRSNNILLYCTDSLFVRSAMVSCKKCSRQMLIRRLTSNANLILFLRQIRFLFS